MDFRLVFILPKGDPWFPQIDPPDSPTRFPAQILVPDFEPRINTASGLTVPFDADAAASLR